MVWIRTVPEAEAVGQVRAVYDHWRERMDRHGDASNVVKVFSITPRILTALVGLRTAFVAAWAGDRDVAAPDLQAP